MSKKFNRNADWTKYQKKRLMAAFGGKCGICGYNKCHKALEFHHVNPNEKEFDFKSLKFGPKYWLKVCEELRKCVMLCANCHREVHDNKATIPDDVTRFDETYTDWMAHVDPAMTNKCPVCKSIKLKFNRTCSLSCAAKLKTAIDWSKVDLQKCVALGYSCDKIAEMLNVSQATVLYHLKKLGLYEPRKKHI